MEERKETKQTNRQTKFSRMLFLEEARCFSRPISYVVNEHHGLVPKMSNIMGTTSSSSVETTSKYNSSAIIFKFYLRQSGLMVSVLNPE